MQYPIDKVMVYDADSNLIVAWSSDGYPVDPVNIPTSSATVKFVTDSTVQFSGFTASWYSFTLCPNGCGGKGWCVNSQCRCWPGYSGADCTTKEYASELTPEAGFQATIGQWESHLYFVNVSYPITSFTLNFAKTPLVPPPYERWGGGFPQFGLSLNEYPSRDPRDRTNNFWLNYFEQAVVINNPPLGFYYIAVYGLEEAGYIIYVQTPVPVAVTTSAPPQNSLNRGGLTAAIVIIVVAIVVVLGIAVGVWYWRRRQGRNFRNMREEDAPRESKTELEDH